MSPSCPSTRKSRRRTQPICWACRGRLIKLLEAGDVPHRVLGAHRRLKAADVLSYRDRRRASQEAMLDELVAENQRLGLYDEE